MTEISSQLPTVVPLPRPRPADLVPAAESESASTQPVSAEQSSAEATADSSNTAVYPSAEAEPVDAAITFPRAITQDARLEIWRGTYVNDNNNVPESKLDELGGNIEALLADPAQRAELVSRYGLDSAANTEALVAAGVAEAGGDRDANGLHPGQDAGACMTVIINRALVKNLMAEMLNGGPLPAGERVSVLDVINEENQFAQTPGRVTQLLAGNDTDGGHREMFAPGSTTRAEFDEIAGQVLAGQTRFQDQDFGSAYYFAISGADFADSKEFFRGDHVFATMNVDDPLRPHYCFEALRPLKGIQYHQ